MTQSLEQAMESVGDPVEYIHRVGPNADSNHLRLFADLPPEFTNWREEQAAWKRSCALADLSHHMNNIHVEGPDALDLFADLGVNDFDDFRPGEAKQFVACSPDGYLIGDGILFHLDEDEFNLVGYGPINWVQYNLETGEYDADAERNDHGGVRDGPPRDFRYQIQGPDALGVIRDAIDGSLPEISFFDFGEISVAGNDVNALRHGMMDEPGFELFGPWEYADEVRQAVLDAGEAYDIQQIGGKAYPTNIIPTAWMSVPLPAIYHEGMEDYREWLDANSFEGALAMAGSFKSDEITDYYLNPVEVGYGRFVDFDHDFVGKEALQDIVENQRREKVTLVWDADDTTDLYGSLFHEGDTYRYSELPIPEWSLAQTDVVVKDGEMVGVANNTRYLYFEKKMFSLACVDTEHSEPGTELTLVWGEPEESPNPRVEPHDQKEITVTVAPAPYYEDKRKTADYTTI